MRHSDWADAGQGWQGKETQSAPAWLEPASPGYPVAPQAGARRRDQRPKTSPEQPLLSFAEVEPDKELWEYAALVTSLDNEILTLGQLYRDRADCENTSTS